MADSLDSGANGEQVRVVLRPQPLWAVPGPEPLPGSALYAAGPGAILVDRRSQLSRVELTEGRLLARLERTPGVPTGLAGIIMPLPAGRWGLGLEDRSLAQVSPDLVIEQIFQRSASPIIAWSESELTYRPGRRVRLTIEDAAPRVLVAREGTTEWWRYPPKNPLTATLVPGLFHSDDQVFLIDDVAVHVIDEDGSACRVFALASRRIGPVVTRQIPGGHLEFLVPTTAGVQHLLPGPRATPLRQILEPVLGSCGPVRLATAGEGIVATTSNRLFAIESGGKAPRWALPLAAEPAWGPVVADGVVALADAAGTVGLVALKDGAPLRRLVHGVPLAAAPILLPGQVVVLDRSGTLTAYPR
jgi:hypothetical protein